VLTTSSLIFDQDYLLHDYLQILDDLGFELGFETTEQQCFASSQKRLISSLLSAVKRTASNFKPFVLAVLLSSVFPFVRKILALLRISGKRNK